MLAHSVTDAVRQQYYSASTSALRALERSSPTNRRFGPDADATWKGFKGQLTDADRLDLLLREAAVQYPSAFAPRVLFAWDGLTEDEPFGPDWESLPDRMVAQLLRGPDAPAGIESRLRRGHHPRDPLPPRRDGRPHRPRLSCSGWQVISAAR
jgi:hypothetical protein